MNNLTEQEIKYYYKQMGKNMIYMFYNKFMERLGLDCYGRITIYDYDEYYDKKRFGETDKDALWMVLPVGYLIENKELYLRFDIVYNADNLISDLKKSRDYENNFKLDSVLFLINFIHGLYHELVHIRQYSDNQLLSENSLKDDYDYESDINEIEAEKEATEVVEMILKDNQMFDLILFMIRGFSTSDYENPYDTFTFNINPPIKRNIKDVKGNEI